MDTVTSFPQGPAAYAGRAQRAPRRFLLAVLALGALVLYGCGSQVGEHGLGCYGGSDSSGLHPLGDARLMAPDLCPPPDLLDFRRSPATDQSATPQRAFKAGIWTDLCHPVVEHAIAITWIVAGPSSGLAYMRADCSTYRPDPRPTTALVPLVDLAAAATAGDATPGSSPIGTLPTTAHMWAIGAAHISKLPPANLPNDETASIPSWLTLPASKYHFDCGFLSRCPAAADSWVRWESSTHDFIAGQTRARVLPPPYDAATATSAITVDGQPGWLTEGHGLASVIVPLPGGGGFFFAGTLAAPAVRGLAAQALPHHDELVPSSATSAGC